MVCVCVSLEMKLRKGLSEKVNYNLKIKGRGVSLVKSRGKNIPKGVVCVRSLRLKKKAGGYKVQEGHFN